MTTDKAQTGATGGGSLPRGIFRTRLPRLMRKELSEILRDRRTMLTLILMPLLVYPLLAVTFQQYFLASRLTVIGEQIYHIGFVSQRDYEQFEDQLRHGSKLLERRDAPADGQPPTGRSTPPSAELTYKPLEVKEDLEEEVKQGHVDLGVRIKEAREFGRDLMIGFELIYKENSRAAEALLEYIEQRLAAANGGFLRSRLGVPNPRYPPVRYAWATRVPMAGPPSRISLGALIPLVLILMTITGAVYPAIDLTAGERERGTLEILVAAPVPRLGLLFAKYVSVLTVAVLTAVINLASMLVTLSITGLGAALFAEHGVSVLLIGEVLGLLLLFAGFFSALLLTITSFARSFKEAQAYLIPIMLLSLGPGVFGMLPGLRLEGWITVAPLVNVVLLSRDLFEHTADPLSAVVVVASTMFYAVAALAVAARLFGAEAVLYSEQSAWSDLWRRPAEARAVPDVSAALSCLALMFPSWFVLQGLKSEFLNLSVLWLFAWLAAMSALLFAGFPLLSAYTGHIRLKSGFRLWPARVPAYLGSIIMGVSLWPVVLQILAYIVPEQLGIDPALVGKSLQSLREARANHPVVLALALLIPGAVEELFFRGYLFSALLQRYRPQNTILTAAVLFGFFHLITTQLFPFERFLSSTLMGLILGWVAWQSGSVIPGMLLHGMHNILLVLMGHSELSRPDAVPWPLVIAGLIGGLIGAVLVFWGRRRTADR